MHAKLPIIKQGYIESVPDTGSFVNDRRYSQLFRDSSLKHEFPRLPQREK
jgi:hypothetical protein